MTLIYVLIAVIAAVAIFKYGWLFYRPTVYFFNGLARIQCREPRLKPGVAMMTPGVVREALDYRCALWKGHDGPHEANVDTEVEPGVRRPVATQWDG